MAGSFLYKLKIKEEFYARMSLLGIDNNLKFVDARQKYPPELSVLCSLEANISSFDLEGSFLYWAALLVHDESVNSPVSFCEELHQRLKPEQSLVFSKTLCTL